MRTREDWMSFKRKAPIVEMKGIHKWYGEVHALKGVDFRIYPSEIVGLIGDNGAGKSTLVNILTGFIHADKGKILYKGEEVKISSVKDAKKLGIEVVYQGQAIVDPLSVAKNIFLGREITKYPFWMNVKKMNEETEKLLGVLGLEISSPEQEAQFCSGGERQGIAVARAMYFGAKVLLLDEPTGGLSIPVVRKVQNYIKSARAQGVGVVFLTHNLQEVYPIADRVVFLSRGEKKLDVEKKKYSMEKIIGLYRR